MKRGRSRTRSKSYSKRSKNSRSRHKTPSTGRRTFVNKSVGGSKSRSRSSRASSQSVRSLPKQYGTGHWESFGHGPRGSSKRAGLIKKLETLLPPIKYFYNSVYQIAATAGIQSVAIVGSTYTPHDILSYNGVDSGNAGYNKVILKDYRTMIDFTNQTNANVKVTLYDFIARRDLTAPDVNGTIITYPAETPLQAWNNSNNTTGSGYSNTYYGAVPFDSQLLCENWKCIGSSEYRLAEGETGTHKIVGQMNKKYDGALLSAQFPQYTTFQVNRGGFKGMTHYCLAVVSGAPTDNANATVTSSIATVDFVTTNKYTYELISPVTAYAQTTQTNVLGTAAGSVWNQGSGAAVAVAVT
jgi:hypothetical protein